MQAGPVPPACYLPRVFRLALRDNRASASLINPVSTEQALTRHGEADDEPLRLPIPGDVSPKLARHGGADKKIAEPYIASRLSDQRTSVLGPGDEDVSSSVRAMNFDLSGGRGKRPILYGICRELV